MKYTIRLSYVFIVLISVLALIIPFFPFDPNYFDPNEILGPIPPSLTHWFGTDDLGRDLLIRTIYGARVSLAIGIISVTISIGLGSIIGVVSGWVGGWIDELIMRFIDFAMAIPTIFLILIIQTLFKPSIINVMIVIGITSWMGVARLVRAEVLSIKERPFVLAAKARSISSTRLLFWHVLPHTFPPVIVAATLDVGNAILVESVLSFLGLGVQPPNASWGNMLQNSLSYMIDAPWMAIIPGLFITLTVLAINFIGDNLRATLNKRESNA